MLLNPDERRALLCHARDTIGAHLTGRPLPILTVSGGLDRHAGAFVTLHLAQSLRGCIGYTEADQPLLQVVSRCAISAATEDPRFPPLRLPELEGVDLEISVLGPVEPVNDPATIEVGRHGLVIQQGSRRGLLLPQVALEWGWDRDTLLTQTCVKAGVPPDAWRKGAKIFKFEAEVFGEQRH